LAPDIAETAAFHAAVLSATPVPPPNASIDRTGTPVMLCAVSAVNAPVFGAVEPIVPGDAQFTEPPTGDPFHDSVPPALYNVFVVVPGV